MPAGAVRDRARIVGTAAGVGVVVGALARLVLAAFPVVDADLVFVVGAACLGFGLLGWSGSVMVGDAVENAKRHMDLATDWTEATSRRAMARIGGVGAGLMLGAVVGAAVAP